MTRGSRAPSIDWLALGLAGLGMLLWLPFPDVLEEAFPAKRAFEMWNWAGDRVSFDPQTAVWPSLSFYVHLLAQHIQFWAGLLTGRFADRYDYFVAARLDPAMILGLGRTVSLIAAGVVVWAGARVARRLTGVAGGLLSGSLLVASPTLRDYAHLVTPDILAAVFVALAVDRLVEIQRNGRMRDYLWAGVWTGLGISSKLTPVLLLPGFFVAHALGPRGSSARAVFADRRPWLGVLAALLAFAITSPFLLLDVPTMARDVSAQTQHMTTLGHFGSPATGPLFYLREVLGPALGWTGLAVSLLGLALGAAMGRPWWIVLACILPFVLGLMLLKTQFPRYALPVLMPLAVGASGVVPALWRLPWPKSEGLRWAMLAGVALLAIVPAADASRRQRAEDSRPTTSRMASDFLRAAAHGRAPFIAAELLSVDLPNLREVETVDPRTLQKLSARQRDRLMSQPSFEILRIPMYIMRPELTVFYYDLRHFVAHDYIVVSQAVRGRYQAAPERFPVQLGFYRDLDHYGSRPRRFGSEQGGRGAGIDIYTLPDSGAALLRERGEPPLDSAWAASGDMNLPDLIPFVEGIGRAALARGRWTMVARYAELLLAAGERAGADPTELSAVREVIADARRRALLTPPGDGGSASRSSTGTRSRSEPATPRRKQGT